MIVAIGVTGAADAIADLVAKAAVIAARVSVAATGLRVAASSTGATRATGNRNRRRRRLPIPATTSLLVRR